MSLQFYKPNSFNTGCAGGFTINSKAGAIYLELLKQISWDAKNQTGSFYNRDDKKKGENVSIQLGRDEIGGLIYAISARKEFKAYHESESQTTNITFGLLYKWDKDKKAYKTDEPPTGYGLSVSRKSKENNAKSDFKLPFTFGESMTLLEFLRFALEKHFSSIYSEDKKKAEERAKNRSTSAPSE